MDVSDLIDFLDGTTTSTAAARRIASILDGMGFRAVTDSRDVPLGSDGSAGVYSRTGGSILAIAAGENRSTSDRLLILAAHTDSPGLRLKHRGAHLRDGLIRVPIEVYGSPILAGWVDRELAIVGRIVSTGPNGLEVREVTGRRPVAIIPNLAIHFNKSVNENLSYDRHEHLQVLVDPGIPATDEVSALERLFTLVAPEIDAEGILDADLAVVPAQGAVALGDQLLVSDRLDNLLGCYSNLKALQMSDRVQTTTVLAFVDHEEIGSVSAVGAAGSWIERTLRLLLPAVGIDSEEMEGVIRRSLLISNDAAHGRHPNYPEKHDGAYAPRLSGGPVIKHSAIMRYASPLMVRAWLAHIAREQGMPIQYLQNRADIPTGSTIGPAIASRLSIPSVDVGIPLLAMHSPRETISLEDVESMAALLAAVVERGIDEVSDAY